MQIRQNKKVEGKNYSATFKKATNWYKMEKDKPRGTAGKLSAGDVSRLVEKETKIRIAPRSIQQAVPSKLARLVGVSVKNKIYGRGRNAERLLSRELPCKAMIK